MGPAACELLPGPSLLFYGLVPVAAVGRPSGMTRRTASVLFLTSTAISLARWFGPGAFCPLGWHSPPEPDAGVDSKIGNLHGCAYRDAMRFVCELPTT